MVAATAGPFTQEGCAPILAVALVEVLNNTQDAELLTGVGMNPFLATEVVRQVDDSSTGNIPNLMGLGCPAALAAAIGGAIDAL